MADLCFICNESLSQGDPVTVVRGLKTLKTASIERNDGHIDFLNSSTPEKTKFLNRLPSTEKKPRQDNQVLEAMAEIFNYIENHDDSQFTLKELGYVLTGCVPNDKTIITRLQKKDPEEERLRIVEAAAAIIREDIRSSVVETKSYPPPSKMLIKLEICSFAYGKTVHYEISAAYHPQSRILSSESGALVRYVRDNADINVHTLDGNTLHVMGMISIVTPKDIY
ncbi:uncharacterized protein TNIN_437171 [Trichonephila inaurata madagascariensis]|uniref:Uncharacterized protein n=1 Tax=Trichonephila inaurata madagascariensis TaxID=2747483 RepID=A0A8X7CPR0_9ARAC|nr:uncharacterized protein TNIN_437171 [Trichonephila inaurata madagascariensis]